MRDRPPCPWNLAQQPLLLREPGSGTRNSVDAILQTVGRKAAPLVESISTASLVSCAASGQGIAILPRSQVRQALAEGRLRELELTAPPFPSSTFWFTIGTSTSPTA
ncbi:MAG: LysR substrate-binding domain-containing protein [Dysosmobacter sp.]